MRLPIGENEFGLVYESGNGAFFYPLNSNAANYLNRYEHIILTYTGFKLLYPIQGHLYNFRLKNS